MQPLIINLAPTGMVPTRAQSPHLPLTPEAIAADCARCAALGAGMFHLHARDAEGNATMDAGRVRETILAVREKIPGAVIVATTSGRRTSDPQQRALALTLEGAAKPDMASLTLGSMNFAAEASVNAPATIEYLAAAMKERGIRPELEIFDTGMANFARRLIDKGLIAPPFYFNILLGNPATAQSRLLHLGAIVADLPPESIWAVAGIGRYQTQANLLGIAMGDGVRVGLEDNLWFDDERTLPASNPLLVERVAAQARLIGREPTTLAELRARLGLTPE